MNSGKFVQVKNIRNVFGLIQNFKMPNVEKPPKPVLFQKPIQSLLPIDGPDSVMMLEGKPDVKHFYEVELGVFIKKLAFNIDPKDIKPFIRGYCVIVDVTRRFTPPETLNLGTVFRAKAGYHLTPYGPLISKSVLSTKKSFDLLLKTQNGEIVGKSTDMFTKVNESISELSRVVPLQPNDLIMTGTPGYLEAFDGDQVDVSISQNGEIMGQINFKTQILAQEDYASLFRSSDDSSE